VLLPIEFVAYEARSLNLWSIHGPALNPSGPGEPHEGVPELRSAGGSSGGSAAAVASGLCEV
jgi:aspartyl-tRNA(Asn)/glutamyl-tRNA(Gln) amidotransferase subunit A